MNLGKQHIDEELVIRYVVGETDGEESAQVEAWIDQSKVNRQSYEQLLKLWSTADPPGKVTPASVDVDTAWKKLRSRIYQYEEIQHKYKVKRRSLSFYVVRAAAIIILGMIVYTTFNYLFQRPDIIQISSNDTTISNNLLPDGTVISLNQQTAIEYQENFTEDERKVKLNGEAYFDVQPDAARPFIVEANEAIITVLGTSFNVKALPSEAAVEVLVAEGSVELANPDRTQATILQIGEKGLFLKETNEVKKETEFDAEALFWLNKTLLFRDTKLSMVFNTLQRLYDVKISVDNDATLNCKLTAKFSNETIENIIDHISTIFNLQITKDGNNFLVRGNGCE